MNCVDENRIGKFEVLQDAINNVPNDVMIIMSECVVIKTEVLFHKKTIEYFAYSPLFRIVERGSEIPEYAAFIDKANNAIFKEKQNETNPA